MIKAIIFDFDGVLVESTDIKTNAFAKLFESRDSKIKEQVVKYHLTNSGVSRFEKLRYIYKNILKEQLDKKTFSDLCQRFSTLVLDEVVSAPYVQGAREFLKKCSNIYKCFVVSATPYVEIIEIIKKRKMFNFFKEIYGAPQKKSEITKEIIDINNLLPSEIIYVGDSISDYKAAELNSVHFIARLHPDNSSIFKDIDCYKINMLDELDSIIKKLSK